MIAYLKEEKLITLDGTSLGEPSHYSLQIIYPYDKLVYISDTLDNIENEIITELYNNNLIENNNYIVHEENGYLEISRKIFIKNE